MGSNYFCLCVAHVVSVELIPYVAPPDILPPMIMRVRVFLLLVLAIVVGGTTKFCKILHAITY